MLRQCIQDWEQNFWTVHIQPSEVTLPSSCSDVSACQHGACDSNDLVSESVCHGALRSCVSKGKMSQQREKTRWCLCIIRREVEVLVRHHDVRIRHECVQQGAFSAGAIDHLSTSTALCVVLGAGRLRYGKGV
eukprot:35361-Rhodomonas_salina.2